MNLAWKIGGALGTLGVVGGSAVAVTQLIYESVKEGLTKVGYKILNLEGEDGDWDTLVSAYKTAYSQKPKPLGDIQDKVTLRKECKKLLSSNLKNNNHYSLASKWCVKEMTIDAMLTANGYTKIGDVDANGNKAKWTKKVELLKQASVNKIEVTFNGNEEEKALKAACDKLNIGTIKTHGDDKFEEKYVQAREWCSEKNKS